MKRDLDSRMLAGCSAFVVVSIGCFGLSLWPFFAWKELWSLAVLEKCCAVGLISALIPGFLFSRKAGIPGASGFVAYGMSFALFLYLRLDQIRLSAIAQQSPELDYPEIMGALIPVGWVLLTLFVAIGAAKEDRSPS